MNPNLGSSPDTDDSTVIELFGCLPVIENLSIHLSMTPYFDQGRVPNKLPAALVHLKYLCIRDTHSLYKYRIPCYIFLIRSSPKLEKLKLKVFFDLSFGISQRYSVTRDNYSDMLRARESTHIRQELSFFFTSKIGLEKGLVLG
ncbi:hypothetical protein L1987_00452 [Smallanthus sonchifolius]|uniref:Uncharacterized protein n=1 Tax=Smallanthus sonchifolius TaxID=185202 RepID=A0ACB9K2B5_9ASTR|nr:hypothetical protein L1987_00452 [Smallanthus sonchifolius]